MPCEWGGVERTRSNLPKSMNCFMDRGDGENFENLSTCFSIPTTEPFLNSIWANFIFFLSFVDPDCQWSEDKVSFLSSPSSSLPSVNLAGLRLGVAQDNDRYINIFRCIQGVLWSSNSAHLGQVVECPSNATSSDERAVLLLDAEGVGLMINQPIRDESSPALYVVEHAENISLK